MFSAVNGRGVPLRVESTEKRALVGENNESPTRVSAVDMVVEPDVRFDLFRYSGCGTSCPGPSREEGLESGIGMVMKFSCRLRFEGLVGFRICEDDLGNGLLW